MAGMLQRAQTGAVCSTSSARRGGRERGTRPCAAAGVRRAGRAEGSAALAAGTHRSAQAPRWETTVPLGRKATQAALQQRQAVQSSRGGANASEASRRLGSNRGGGSLLGGSCGRRLDEICNLCEARRRVPLRHAAAHLVPPLLSYRVASVGRQGSTPAGWAVHRQGGRCTGKVGTGIGLGRGRPKLPSAAGTRCRRSAASDRRQAAGAARQQPHR